MLLTKKKKKITNLYNKASCKLLTFNFNSKLNHFRGVENFLETLLYKIYKCHSKFETSIQDAAKLSKQI